MLYSPHVYTITLLVFVAPMRSVW